MSTNVDTVALLLSDRSPALRYRALVEVDGLDAADAEVVALRAGIDASREMDRVRSAVATAGDDIRALSFALCRIAYLGLGRGTRDADAIAATLFRLQRKDGSWALGGAGRGSGDGANWLPIQTALPLRGLAAAGFATDPRTERGYEWLLERRLDDGSWPTGMASGQRRYVMGYRRLPRSEGCRASTTAAAAALVHHPERRTSVEARSGIELLLQRETRDEWTLGYEVARLLGAEPVQGHITFYARFDLAFLLDVATRSGVAADDARVSDLVDFLLTRRGAYGLWEHPQHPHLNRWLTLDILASLARLPAGDWVGSDFRTRFQAYPKRRERY